MVRNVDLAEELAQDALVAALAEWPRTGVPTNPGAWLMAVAKRRAIDALRRDRMRTRKHEEIARTLDETFAQNSCGREKAPAQQMRQLDAPFRSDARTCREEGRLRFMATAVFRR